MATGDRLGLGLAADLPGGGDEAGGGGVVEGEAGLEHGAQDAQIPVARRPAGDVEEGRAGVLVPGGGEDLGERGDRERVAVGGQHRTHPAPTVGVGAGDDTVLLDALEHRPLGLRREGVDGKPKALGTLLSHRLSTSLLGTGPAGRARA
ncbi:MAG: hypothetical protein LC720_07170 [Actinobacteria bacterium]|nr:hypothetical protein [Actinomycetota bacterium]